jgi:DNA-binding MarR family transcriptional regulator
MSKVDSKQCAALMERIEELSSRYVESMATNELTGVQALMLMRLGDREQRIGDLGNIYFGTNISYNVKKLVEMKYIVRKGGTIDKRVGLISLTSKGKEIRADLEKRHQMFAKHLDDHKLTALANAIQSLRSVLSGDRFPTGIIF